MEKCSFIRLLDFDGLDVDYLHNGEELKPIILVDKSFIQSLSLQEANTLNTHFSILISPILIQEMITDIVKRKNSGDVLQKLKSLADKLGGIGQYTITDARNLFCASLMGNRFGSKPQIPVINPKQVKAPDGSLGFIIEETPERKLIRNWQSKKISNEDIKAANNYLSAFEAYYSIDHHREMAIEFPINKRFNNLDDLVTSVDIESLSSKVAPMFLESVSKMTRISSDVKENARLYWEKNGKSSFESQYPYAFFFTRLFLIYSLGLTNSLIPASKHSNAVNDIQYFLYLPFCHAFCSGDRFHEENFKYFQRPEQTFIWGQNFKRDLDTIGSFFNSLTPEDKINYNRLRGNYPPPIPDSISVNLWCEVFGPWEQGRFGNRAVDMSEDEKKELVDYLNEIYMNRN